MVEYLIKYIMEEGRCEYERASEVAYNIMDIVDEMIHDRLDGDDDDEE